MALQIDSIQVYAVPDVGRAPYTSLDETITNHELHDHMYNYEANRWYVVTGKLYNTSSGDLPVNIGGTDFGFSSVGELSDGEGGPIGIGYPSLIVLNHESIDLTKAGAVVMMSPGYVDISFFFECSADEINKIRNFTFLDSISIDLSLAQVDQIAATPLLPVVPDQAIPLRAIELEHADYVRDTAISLDGSILASASQDEMVKLWRMSDGSLLNTLFGHTDDVTSVAISPDGTLLASASRDNTVKLWRVSDGTLLSTLPDVSFRSAHLVI